MDEKKEKKKKINVKSKKEAERILSKKNAPPKTKTKKAAVKIKKTTAPKEKSITPDTLDKVKEKKTTVKKKETKKTVEKKTAVKKTPKKKESAIKVEIPKEWIPNKEKISTPKAKEPINDQNIGGKLKSSIFEEIDEKTFLEEKKQQKERLKKMLLVLLIVVVAVLLTIFLLFKYNDFVKKQFKLYDKYYIGEKVTLDDSSVWYVVDDSNANEDSVKLLKESVLDVNKDTLIDDNDKKKFNSSNSASYDVKDEESIAYYLENEYKSELSDAVGDISEIGLLTSKEFVRMRDKMGFGYEWSEGNILADISLGNWWIDSVQNEKVFAV